MALNICIGILLNVLFVYPGFRSEVATDEHVKEAIRLFNVATMDAARSGINNQINLTPEMANEIKVKQNSGICIGFFLGLSSQAFLLIFM